MRKREVSTADPLRRGALTLSVVMMVSAVTCVPPPATTVSPSSGSSMPPQSSVLPPSSREADTAAAINFGDAFEPVDTVVIWDTTVQFPIVPQIENVPVESLRFPPFPVRTSVVRVALRLNTRRVVAYSAGAVTLRHARSARLAPSLRGRLIFEAKAGTGMLSVTTGKNTLSAALPCTLLSEKQYGFIELGDTTYRGSLVFRAGKPGTISVINHLGIEEYLRGVVPLEMGNRTREEIEALKAQAVAARTYTFRRIAECAAEPYDLLSSVADQVYGGASVENREADLAVTSTANLIMVSGDSVIMAYYHSTCGGITADVHEAWGKPARTYLGSIVDVDDAGRPWCRASSYFSWDESWSRKQFSAIVLESLRRTFPQKQFTGAVDGLTVDERYNCGRARRLTINGSGWSQVTGGDQIRFILRRGVAGSPILRSSNFTVITDDRNSFSVSGKGYGHGVGMCQTGAIGRAQAGQNFVTILKSYYTGVSIALATVEER